MSLFNRKLFSNVLRLLVRIIFNVNNAHLVENCTPVDPLLQFFPSFADITILLEKRGQIISFILK